jgi:hypothetical protein
MQAAWGFEKVSFLPDKMFVRGFAQFMRLSLQFSIKCYRSITINVNLNPPMQLLFKQPERN